MRGSTPGWRALAHFAGLVPLLAAAWLAWRHGLGVNPVESLELWTGRAALVLLLLSLACSPASTLLGWRRALAARRTLGLYAFLYAAVHLGVFVAVDYGLDVALLRDAALPEKPFILAGAGSFAILLALAATSWPWSKRRLGRNWTRLHRLVYVAAALAALHYAWKVKALSAGPVVVALVLVLLLAARLPPVRRAMARARAARLAP